MSSGRCMPRPPAGMPIHAPLRSQDQKTVSLMRGDDRRGDEDVVADGLADEVRGASGGMS